VHDRKKTTAKGGKTYLSDVQKQKKEGENGRRTSSEEKDEGSKEMWGQSSTSRMCQRSNEGHAQSK